MFLIETFRTWPSVSSYTFVTNINLEPYPFPKAKERADERQRDGDTEPERQQGNES